MIVSSVCHESEWLRRRLPHTAVTNFVFRWYSPLICVSRVIKMKMFRLLPHKFGTILIVMVCFLPLAQAQSGPLNDVFSEPIAIKEGISAIVEKTGPAVRAFSVEIAPNRITLLAQDPSNRRHIQEWRL